MIENFLLFSIGLFFGSFFLVVIDRLPKEKNPLIGRSVCDHCGHVLSWYDLFPVLSFFSLGGKCRYCRKKVSIYYPLVEIITGILFVLTHVLVVSGSRYLAVNIELLFALFTISTFIIIFFTDLKYGLIPFIIVIPASIVTVFYLLLTNPSLLLPAAFSAVGAGVFFLIIFLITRGRGMGFGDVILSSYLGFLLGYPGIIIALYIAFLTGAFGSLILILIGRKKLKGSTIPFGPFLILGAYIAFFWGEQITAIVYQFLGI